MQVSDWEFRGYISSNPYPGTTIDFIGSYFAGRKDYQAMYGQLLTYNSGEDAWGVWRRFNIHESAPVIKMTGEGDSRGTDAPLGMQTVGLKWMGIDVDAEVDKVFKNTGAKIIVGESRKNGSITYRQPNFWGNINQNHGWLGAFVYEQYNGLNIFAQGWIPSEYLTNLDGSIIERGEKAHQDAAIVGLTVIGGQITGAARGMQGLSRLSTKLGAVADDATKTGVQYTKSSLQLGQQMHKAYKVGDVVEGVAMKEFRGIPGIRPDFVDFSTKTIYELKPFNPRAMQQGWNQLNKYQNLFQQKYGGTWKTVLDTY